MLISRVRRNAVGYEPAVPPAGPRKRGRPRRYGLKVRLRELFDSPSERWQQAESPVYGERSVTIRFLSRDLMWRPLRRLVRFVLVIHPTRARCILLSTNLSLPALEIIAGYGLHSKIELSFKQALRVIGAYRYHFWMQGMECLSRSSGTQYLHRTSEHYRNAVRRKITAYHLHIQLGLIAQGLLQYLAIKHSREVRASFGSWLRTIRPGLCPSELVSAAALRNALPEYLADCANASQLQKFLRSRIDPELSQPPAPRRIAENSASQRLRDSRDARIGLTGEWRNPRRTRYSQGSVVRHRKRQHHLLRCYSASCSLSVIATMQNF